MAQTLKLPRALWKHQRLAVETVNDYLESDAAEGRSALITMPTGTGKTGVIAAIVSSLPAVEGHRLVLTPWDALVRQLQDDLAGRFWERLPERQRPTLLPVRRLPPSADLHKLKEIEEPTIFVATIAAISVARRRAAELGYKLPDLFVDFGCVLVDEGHYEPAFEWSQAIRALDRPTILLTATPYRNDEKFFTVDEDHRYHFRHWEAEQGRFLRTPKFEVIGGGSDVSVFAAELLEHIETAFPGDESVRVIVRCKTPTRIRQVVEALQVQGQAAIGVHETFAPGDSVLRRAVPRPDAVDARFWVHQNKLIEGIDDPNFKVLAFHDALRNGRAIVQQIGRVLRNPTLDPNDMTALVVGGGDLDVERTWKAYRSFDLQDDAESVATFPQLVQRVLDAQPGAFYYDGGYRSKIDLTRSDAWQEFSYPLRTQVFRAVADRPPALSLLTDIVAAELGDVDRAVFATQVPDGRTTVIPFVTAENSSLLRSGTFIEPEFGYTVLRLSGSMLFLHDTRGRVPKAVLKYFRPLQPPELQRLFPKNSSSLTSVALSNTDTGRQAARSRTIRAAAIDALAPDLSDYAHVCTIAEGYTGPADDQFRRYLGLSRSRVTDYRATERDFASYSDWLDDVEAQLTTKVDHAVTFTRYATYVEEPENTDPLHVLIDIDPTSFAQADGTPLDIEDRAAEIKEGHFSITVNDQVHPAGLSWDGRMKRYEFRAPTLQDQLFVTTEGEHRELVAEINAGQMLRVVPESRTAIYSHGSFFKPIVPATKIGSFRLLDILYPMNELAAAKSEKGAAIVNGDWEPDSLFGFISAMAPNSNRIAPAAFSNVFAAPDFLLCTDLGTEVADFVVTQGRRVAFIHAKASATPRYYSASALQDVASQAIKNLPHLQPLADIHMRTNSWTKEWKTDDKIGSTARLREGAQTTGPDMWKHIRSVIADPASEREIWIVLGELLSKKALEDQAKKQKPAAEAIQVFALLQTTWGAVSQLGCRLRIFCSP